MRSVSMKKITSQSFIKDMIYIVMSLFLLILVSEIFDHAVYAQNSNDDVLSNLSITYGDEWYYFKGTTKPPDKWKDIDFDARNWQRGPTDIGYGTGANNTILEDMRGNYSAIYARGEFTIAHFNMVNRMNLSVVCDGPFIAYLNGVEMMRTKTIQDHPIGVADAEQYNVSGFIHELIPGKNVLALQCENDDINSKDFSFIPVFEVFEKRRGQ